MGLAPQTVALLKAARQLVHSLPADAVLLLTEDDLNWDTVLQHLDSCRLLVAVRSDQLRQGADVVALYNGIDTGEDSTEPIDTLSVIHLGEHIERLSAQDLRQLDTQVPLETLRAVVDLAVEIGREGREGHPVGTMFVVGDTRKVLTMTRPMNFNPF